MATTNIQLFNENQNNTLLDNEYNDCEERNNGFLGTLARANVFNKFCYQISLVCKAIANFMVGRGYNANDTDPAEFSDNFRDSIISAITEQINLRIPNARAKNTAYQKGDIVIDASLPLWGELECITAGTTSDSDFSSLLPNPVQYIGLQIQDGGVLWVLRAKRFSSCKGVPIPFVGLFVAHTVSENGTTKTYYVPKHPELNLEMLDYRFCDGQTVSGYSTINMQNRFLMCKSSARANNGYAGTDEVAIKREHLPTGNWILNLTCNDWNKKFNLEGSFKTGGQSNQHTHNAGESILPTYGGGIHLGARSVVGGNLPTTGASADHTHQVTVSFKNINITHKHSLSGTVTLNPNSQQKISVVSQHYKIGYIQRIY